jgi:hypothetical protein
MIARPPNELGPSAALTRSRGRGDCGSRAAPPLRSRAVAAASVLQDFNADLAVLRTPARAVSYGCRRHSTVGSERVGLRVFQARLDSAQRLMPLSSA